MTPAQASGFPNFVVDVPVQGPTDPGMRAGSCWWAQNVIPAKSSCSDCTGLVPAWTRVKLAPGGPGGPSAGIGDNMEAISFGGVGVHGFSLGAITDPDIWPKLDRAQQLWVAETLNKLNDVIVRTTKTTCPTFAPNVPAAVGCFQSWVTANFKGPTTLTLPDGTKVALRTDGVLDQDTLNALIAITGNNAPDFPNRFPGNALIPTTTTTSAKQGLSTGAMAGLAVGGAAVVGGLIYVATRKPGRKK